MALPERLHLLLMKSRRTGTRQPRQHPRHIIDST
jgi:hypothetical protein